MLQLREVGRSPWWSEQDQTMLTTAQYLPQSILHLHLYTPDVLACMEGTFH